MSSRTWPGAGAVAVRVGGVVCIVVCIVTGSEDARELKRVYV